MVIHYWDPIAGNNANDGLSFANRKLSLSALTGAVAGDTIRCIASPDPEIVGVNFTFTSQSGVGTLASSVTTNVYMDGAWTANTNVTATTNTTNHREGSNCASLAVAAAFTTGRIGHFGTGLLDLSGSEILNLWLRSSITVATNVVRVDLCSDTGGTTPVNSFTVNVALTANVWMPLVFNNAAPLGASIQSIALTALSDPGTPTFLIDDSFTSKAAAATDSITLDHRIGKNTISDPYWYDIRSINGTSIVYDTHVGSLPTQTGGYYGVTETVPLYKRQSLQLGPGIDGTTAYHTPPTSGTSEALLLISGGWNRTDMSTQLSETWLSGRNGKQIAIATSSGQSFINFEKFNFSRFQHGYQLDGPSQFILGDAQCTSMGDGTGNGNASILRANSNWRMGGVTGTLISVHTTGIVLFDGAYNVDIYGIKQIGAIMEMRVGHNTPSNKIRIRNYEAQMPLVITGVAHRSISFNRGGDIEIDDASVFITTTRAAFNGNPNFGRIIFNRLNILQASVIFENGSIPVINNLTYTTMTSGAWNSVPKSRSGRLRVTSGKATSFGNGTLVYHLPYYLGKRFHSLPQGGGIGTDNIIYHSGSESWYIQPTDTDYVSADRAIELDPDNPFRVYVEANKTLTFSAYVLRTHPTEVSCRLRIQGGRLNGIEDDIYGTDPVAAASVWEQISITATPTESGVVEIIFEAWMETIAAVIQTVQKRAYIDDIDWQVT